LASDARVLSDSTLVYVNVTSAALIASPVTVTRHRPQGVHTLAPHTRTLPGGTLIHISCTGSSLPPGASTVTREGAKQTGTHTAVSTRAVSTEVGIIACRSRGTSAPTVTREAIDQVSTSATVTYVVQAVVDIEVAEGSKEASAVTSTCESVQLINTEASIDARVAGTVVYRSFTGVPSEPSVEAVTPEAIESILAKVLTEASVSTRVVEAGVRNFTVEAAKASVSAVTGVATNQVSTCAGVAWIGGTVVCVDVAGGPLPSGGTLTRRQSIGVV